MSTRSKVLDFEPVWVWGVPFAPWTFSESLDAVERMVESGQPGFFITANLQYVMLTHQAPRLAEVNERAEFIIADGWPIVTASKWKGGRLPERVAGSDMVPALCERAARKGHRVYFLGGAPGIADEAAQRLRERFPGLPVAGTACPPFREPTPAEHEALIARIRDAGTQILFVAFGQPRGELWLLHNLEALGVPACVQIGASLDFVAGKVQRAPKWSQRLYLEWFYRMTREPARLAPRYWRNGLFLMRMLARDLVSRREGPRQRAKD